MAIRWITDGEPHAAEVYNRPLRDYIQESATDYVKQSTVINVGNGLVGGGALVGTSLDINGVDASTSQKGVVRFATLTEANNGTAGVVVGADVLKNMSGGGLGEGQTWQNMTTSRVTGTTYTNNTGKPIMVFVRTNGGVARCELYVDGVLTWYISDGDGDGSHAGGTTIVPNGSSYRQAGHNRNYWAELR